MVFYLCRAESVGTGGFHENARWAWSVLFYFTFSMEIINYCSLKL